MTARENEKKEIEEENKVRDCDKELTKKQRTV